MNPRQQTPPTIKLFTTLFIILILAGGLLSIDGNVSNAQGNIQVNASDPAATEQGTINLNVKVTGKGFKNGAKAKWQVTGTTDTGGVTVNSTTFVSSNEVTANITVADTASISTFDIQVTNSDGRGGKGTELFRVTAKQAKTVQCPVMQPAPTSDTKCYGLLAGCLDSTFGGAGYVHSDLYPAYVSGGDNAERVVVQPDGKIVVAGRTRISTTNIEFTLIRYNLDGTLDLSFGDPEPMNPPSRRGYTLTPITSAFDYIHGLALQPDGKIVVSGTANGNGVAVRYKGDGTLDPVFGNGGIVQLPSGSPNNDVALQSDGKIVITGAAPGGFALVRLNTNGSLDSTFGSHGTVIADPPGGSRRGSGSGLYVAIQRVPAITGEERIVVAGWSTSTGPHEWTLMRFRSNGTTDTTFGISGAVKTSFSGFGDEAHNVLIDSSNRIVVAGVTSSADISCGSYVQNAAVVRYTQDGGLDNTFSGGKQIVDVYGGNDVLPSPALQADGKILLFETAKSSDGSQTHIAIVRFNADGTRDSSFGLQGNGIVTTDLFGTQSWAMGGGAIDPTNGKIVVAGGAYLIPPFSQGEFAVARYLP